MESCRRFGKLIDLYLDGEADETHTKMLLSHTENCKRCRDKLEETKKLHSIVKSAGSPKLPDGFHRAVIARIHSEVLQRNRAFGISPIFVWLGTVTTILLIIAGAWYVQRGEPTIPFELHIVSPREDAVVEQQYADISVAFTASDVRNIQVILDGKDVTDATEINEDFLIYTSDILPYGYHVASVQITDSKIRVKWHT